MITMGFDLSSTCCGWCVFDNQELIDCGAIRPITKGLEWRDRLKEMIPQLTKVVDEYKPNKCYVEEVPLMGRGNLTLVILGAVQGSMIGLLASKGIEVQFIGVSNWRSEIGLFTGKKADMCRDEMKQHSIEYANKTFGLELLWVSKSSKKNEDDIADAINVCWSQIKPKEIKRELGRKK